MRAVLAWIYRQLRSEGRSREETASLSTPSQEENPQTLQEQRSPQNQARPTAPGSSTMIEAQKKEAKRLDRKRRKEAEKQREEKAKKQDKKNRQAAKRKREYTTKLSKVASESTGETSTSSRRKDKQFDLSIQKDKLESKIEVGTLSDGQDAPVDYSLDKGARSLEVTDTTHSKESLDLADYSSRNKCFPDQKDRPQHINQAVSSSTTKLVDNHESTRNSSSKNRTIYHVESSTAQCPTLNFGAREFGPAKHYTNSTLEDFPRDQVEPRDLLEQQYELEGSVQPIPESSIWNPPPASFPRAPPLPGSSSIPPRSRSNSNDSIIFSGPVNPIDPPKAAAKSHLRELSKGSKEDFSTPGMQPPIGS